MCSRAERVKQLQSLASAELADARFVDPALLLRMFDDDQMRKRLVCTKEQLVDAAGAIERNAADVKKQIKP
jgi:hypothetical protein